MPRGRPKKNTTSTSPILEAVTTFPEMPVIKPNTEEGTATEKNTANAEALSSKPKKKDEYPLCACCKSPVYSKRRLNLTLLTTLAPYYFDIVDTQPYVCSKCATDLGKVINNFFVKRGAEVKPYSQTGIKSENVLEEKL